MKDDWIGGDVSESNHSTRAKEIYQSALSRFSQSGTQDERKIAFVHQAGCLQDVESLVNRAKSDYESSRNPRLNRWLGGVSRRLMYYSKVFDVLAQHHPEYVALAWGAMKFLFIAVLNHENAIASLSEGISRIADALPKVQLATMLYPTDKMINAVEELYAYILRFFIRAHDWYSEGTLRHILHSITRPAELRYKDLLEDIARCSHKIDQLAVCGSQVELREVHQSLKAVTSQLERSEGVMADMKAMMINYQAINSSSLLDTNQKVTDLQFSEMIRIVSTSSLTNPMESFRHGLLMRKRRQMQSKSCVPPAFWRSPALQSFSHSQTSFLILVKGNFKSRFTLRDAAVSMTEELQRKHIPVLWAVRTGPPSSCTNAISSNDVLKSLVAQALRWGSSSRSESSAALSCARLQTASTETDWFSVLGSALENLHEQIYIILDLDLIVSTSSEELVETRIIHLFFSLFQELVRRGLNQKVKVMVFTYKPITSPLGSKEGFASVSLSATPTTPPMRRRRQPKPFRSGGPNYGR